MLPRAVDFALYHIVRPIGRRAPFWVLNLVTRALAVPIGVGMFLFRSDGVPAYLLVVGHRADAWGRLTFSIRKAWRRLADDTFYLRWDEPPQIGPKMTALREAGDPVTFASWSWMGVSSMARLAPLYDARIIRLPYGGEGGPDPDEVPLGGRWAAHQAWVRDCVIGPNQILPGASPRLYLQAIREGRTLMIVQDVTDATGASPQRSLVGVESSLPVGGIRLARAGKLPVYLLHARYRRGQMVFEADGPLDVDEQGLLDRISDCIRAEPWVWDHWRSVVPDGAPAPTITPELEARPIALQPAA